jgi:glycosyltransferase involved in cell wall biosynthesis
MTTEQRLSAPDVTILIPHYKTPELVKHCLALLQKFTPPGLAHYIVIDNDSQDNSLDYLRNLTWIELIERKSLPDETPPQSHSRALDAGFLHVKTPYVLSIHTDTLIKHPGWLDYLLNQINVDRNIAGVGSWKLETYSWHKKILKSI